MTRLVIIIVLMLSGCASRGRLAVESSFNESGFDNAKVIYTANIDITPPN